MPRNGIVCFAAFNKQHTSLIVRMDGLAKRLNAIEQETANQLRKWNLVTGKADTGELNRQARYLDILSNLFSQEDLEQLCFELGVDYDALPGSGKTGKARELLIWTKNRNRLNRLYRLVHEARPFLFEE